MMGGDVPTGTSRFTSTNLECAPRRNNFLDILHRHSWPGLTHVDLCNAFRHGNFCSSGSLGLLAFYFEYVGDHGWRERVGSYRVASINSPPIHFFGKCCNGHSKAYSMPCIRFSNLSWNKLLKHHSMSASDHKVAVLSAPACKTRIRHR